jgi:1-deoxyxylulose-5-phosphate synthase
MTAPSSATHPRAGFPERRPIGTTDLKTLPLAVGSMNFGRVTTSQDACEILDLAIESGINLINTGDTDYSGRSEEIVGTFLRSRGIRDRVILSVEISGPDMGVPNSPNLTAAYILPACERALERLQTDYIDLYVIPRPNPRIPIQDTLGAISVLQQAGKVLHCGTSTYPAWMVLEAIHESEVRGLPRVAADLSPYNLLDRRLENEFLPMASKHGISVLAWAPLAQGVLANRYHSFPDLPSDSRASLIGGIYRDRVTQSGVSVSRQIAGVAERFGYTPAQLAFLWVKSRAQIAAPIIGFRESGQLLELLRVIDRDLTPDCLDELDILNPPGSVVTNFFNTAPWMQSRIQ